MNKITETNDGRSIRAKGMNVLRIPQSGGWKKKLADIGVRLAFCCVPSMSAIGETYTWKGGTGSFSEPQNWTTSSFAHSVPSGDNVNLIFPAGDNVITGMGTLSVSTMSVGAGLTDFQFGSAGGTLTFSGEISGAGAVKSTANESANCIVILKGNNTFAGGYTNYGGETQLYTDNCLGTGKGVFWGNSKQPNFFYARANLNITNAVEIGRSVNWAGPIKTDGHTVTFSGPVEFSAGNISGGSGLHRLCSTVVFAGSLVRSSSTTGTGIVCDGSVSFNCLVSGQRQPVYFNADNAVLEFGASNNIINSIAFRNSFGTIRLNATNVFDVENPGNISFCCPDTPPANAATYTVDLKGHDQVVDAVTHVKTYKTGINCVVKSDDPARITMRGTSDNSFCGHFDGAISLVWDPVTPCTYTLTNVYNETVSTMNGALVVSNGTMKVRSSMKMPNLSEIEVADGATLEFDNGFAVSSEYKRIKIGYGAYLKFGTAKSLVANEVIVVDEQGNEKSLQAGTYDKIEGLSGARVTVRRTHIEVPDNPVTWKSSNLGTAFQIRENWVGIPDFTAENTVASFASAGVLATTEENVSLKGVVFNSGDAFQLDGAGTISICEGGVKATGGDNYTINNDIRIGSEQKWEMGAGSILIVNGAIGGYAERLGLKVTTTGLGTVYWQGAEGDFAGEVAISNQTTVVRNNAFKGRTGGKIEMYDFPEGSTHVYFRNALVDRDISISTEGVTHNNYGSSTFFNTVSGVTNVFNGLISIASPNYVRFQCDEGGVCDFAGGIEMSAYGIVLNGAGLYRISKEPVEVPYIYMNDSTGNLEIAANGNRFSSGIRVGNSNADVVCRVKISTDEAFAYLPALYLSSSSVVDLNGHDMFCARLLTESSGGHPVVHSDTVGALNVTNVSSDVSHSVSFTGGASLVKGGEKCLTLSSAANTSTGTVSVTSGELAFAENAAWRSASAFYVGKWCRLTVKGSRFFGHKSVVNIAHNIDSTGLNLVKSGVTHRVRALYFDGVRQPETTYGTSTARDQNGNPPAVIDNAHFQGNGVLRVIENPGLGIIVR